ncbi:MAG: response regulator [Gemmatimonadaceae bacterium]|nr:response regulator [Gemmatimonadaceae bacterium]MDQ3518997.1 response regulator [Gemmatimonadota bacterium]
MLHLNVTHSTAIVAVSIGIAFLASYAALDLAGRITAARGRVRLAWLLGGSITMGVGIWSMHGVAMLALKLPVEVRYDSRLVLISVLLAIAASSVALSFASRPRLDYPRLGVAGMFMGIAVAGMHYIGMASMRMLAVTVYSPVVVGLSVGIAVTASCAALWMAFTLRENDARSISVRRIGAAVIMGLAIAGMHYTGMHAAHFVASAQMVRDTGFLLASHTMFEVTTLTTILVLGVALIGLVFDRRMYAQAVHLKTLAAAEVALRASDERYQLAFRATNDIIWDWNLITGEMLLNDVREQMFGAESGGSGQMISRTVDWSFSLIHPEDVGRVRATIETLREGEASMWSEEYRTRRHDGSYATVVNRAHIVRSPDGKAIRAIGAMMDISDRKLAEQALQDARDAAQTANRAKSEFLANMSHEIRTPMNGVMGMVGLALDTELSAEQREYLQVAQSSAESLLTVINDILDFSKIEAGKLELSPETFRLRDALGDTVRTLALRADQKGLELAINVMPDVPESLFGDVNRIRQVVVNLVGNAIKFTTLGEVVVTVDTVPHEHGPVPIEAAPGDVTVHVAVTDTGIGIPHDKHRLIFEAFTQADSSTTRHYGGTGLGLSISAQLVELMGGRIWVESTPGEGSTFHFTLRLNRRTGVLGTTTLGRRAVLAGMSVLIVDDNATNRRILEQTVRGWEMLPTLVPGGAEALAALEAAQRAGHPFQLVLLDAQMPTMDGFGVAEAISRRTELVGATVMMLSSSGQHSDVARCTEVGIASYLTKPVKSSHLLDAILSVIETTPSADLRDTRSAESVPAPSRPSLKILLAEDNLVNQMLTVGLLSKRGHSTTIASNGLLAVEAFSLETFDVILMDVQMPEMGGFEATAAIRERERSTAAHIPIIAMTARAMSGDREQCLAAGMDAYIAKPIRPSELIALVEAYGYERMEPAPAPMLSDHAHRDLSVLDETALLALVGGDEQLMQEIVTLFLDEYPRILRSIQASSARGDVSALQFSAHALKGSVGNMAAARAYEAAIKLDAVACTGQLPAAREAVAALESELARLEDALTGIARKEFRPNYDVSAVDDAILLSDLDALVSAH